jgi:hypothetical protein
LLRGMAFLPPSLPLIFRQNSEYSLHMAVCCFQKPT